MHFRDDSEPRRATIPPKNVSAAFGGVAFSQNPRDRALVKEVEIHPQFFWTKSNYSVKCQSFTFTTDNYSPKAK